MTTDREEQEERRQTLLNDARVARERSASTYHQFAIDEADTPRGRYATVEKASVVGAGPPTYPPQPEISPWRADPVPPEPLIDATDCGSTFGIALGEPHEIAASIAAQDAPILEQSSPFSNAQGNCGDPAAAPSASLPVDAERVGSPPFLKEEE